MNVLLVDDEDLARKRLRRLLEAAGGVTIAGEAQDGLDALEKIEALAPEVVFLDITMPKLDGFGVAAALKDKGPRVVFVTTHDDKALQAFEANAVDYLLKPVSAERLAAALAKLRTTAPPPRLPARSSRMAVRCGAKFVVFEAAAIVCIEAKDDYAEIVLSDRKLLADDSLDALALRLPADFVRIHRSALINLTHLKELVREGDRKYVAVMDDFAETRLAVARERLNELKALLGLDWRQDRRLTGRIGGSPAKTGSPGTGAKNRKVHTAN
jgi:DNA-binding LytR/AlgR family response regulator